MTYQKGHIPWNRGTKGVMKANSGCFKKGYTPWNKGKKMSEVQKEKISITHFERNNPTHVENRSFFQRILNFLGI